MTITETVPPLPEKQLTAKEFAEWLRVSRWTIYGWIAEGRIRSVKIGRLVRIPESELERIIRVGERRGTDARSPPE